MLPLPYPAVYYIKPPWRRVIRQEHRKTKPCPVSGLAIFEAKLIRLEHTGNKKCSFCNFYWGSPCYIICCALYETDKKIDLLQKVKLKALFFKKPVIPGSVTSVMWRKNICRESEGFFFLHCTRILTKYSIVQLSSQLTWEGGAGGRHYVLSQFVQHLVQIRVLIGDTLFKKNKTQPVQITRKLIVKTGYCCLNKYDCRLFFKKN